ncbi:MAG: SCP2 sterol-binding domain-containing protein [Ardenticatenaceae bacterium]|nr:SCP2 sterol-binding domain-containing protein [Anaerolineales bacterium]MCB8923297.1 SCP2 sterol-binding domain-containing protein [Ardenticatenaceae bacterium]MCB8992037.1 SCP2 sterol-binding domain-containing protein [Ardenticatenaceae bacterium]MCB9004704.1 SCP2 sterol-binding domain-containing protein [Ardenticatenaceae bacterium]
MPTVTDVFKEMPNRFNASAAAGLNATVQFSLSGDGGGDWYVTIADGSIEVDEGKVDSPKAAIIMDANDFVAMSSGELNAMAAFMSGKIKVEGDLSTVMQMQSLLGL